MRLSKAVNAVNVTSGAMRDRIDGIRAHIVKRTPHVRSISNEFVFDAIAGPEGFLAE